MSDSLKNMGPSILDLAQLALDVYHDPDNDTVKHLFSSKWIKMDAYPPDDFFIDKRRYPDVNIHALRNKEIKKKPKDSCPESGLYARIYYSSEAKYSVLAIRGTEPTDMKDISEDVRFANNSETELLQV